MITIVTGAPCSGKSTWVKEQAQSGDIIIDMDSIALALTTDDIAPHDYSETVRSVAKSARLAAVKSAVGIATGHRDIRVFVIHTDPTPQDRMNYRIMGATLHECKADLATCLKRLKSRPKNNQLKSEPVIRKYFADRGNNG